MNAYRVQLLGDDGQWFTIAEEARSWCWGYLAAYNTWPPPSRAIRLVLGERVLDHRPARTGVDVGLIAGWPTAEQYEAAAAQALDTAAKIREARAREAARREGGL
jgi:hypothetical protein